VKLCGSTMAFYVPFRDNLNKSSRALDPPPWPKPAT
jgi:hypothetical protein